MSETQATQADRNRPERTYRYTERWLRNRITQLERELGRITQIERELGRMQRRSRLGEGVIQTVAALVDYFRQTRSRIEKDKNDD